MGNNIQTGFTITYSKLIDETVDYIVQKCYNVTDNITTSTSNIKTAGTPVAGYINNTNPTGWVNKNIRNSTSDQNTSVTFTVQDGTYENEVLATTVKKELTDFLKGRNLYNLTDVEISHKSLINYVSNISHFVCNKMVNVVNSFSSAPNGYLVYLSSNTIAGSITNANNIELTKTEIQNNITSITDVNSLSSNVHTIAMTINYNCSSSSSSCSSSSCSSSSSLFIAYMNID